MRAGYDVHIALGGVEPEHRERIKAGRLILHELPLSRSGRNLYREIVLFFSLVRLFFRLKPDLLHLVTIKPVIYGGIAARISGTKRVVAAISGLGFVFVAQGKVNRLFRRLIVIGYRLALKRKSTSVIFQNPDDQRALLRLGAIAPEQARLIRGSGVDLEVYNYQPEPEGTPVVCFAARLLRDKGIFEFVEAADILRRKGVEVRFRAVGDIDRNNPASITGDQLERWKSDGCVEFPGFSSDISREYARCHIVCLPSYREGLPKSLLEAAACGRAVITTDVPGCRDAIDEGNTGLLVPARDAKSLAEAIQTLVEDGRRRADLGRSGRELAEREFAVGKVVDQHLHIYRELARAV